MSPGLSSEKSNMEKLSRVGESNEGNFKGVTRGANDKSEVMTL